MLVPNIKSVAALNTLFQFAVAVAALHYVFFHRFRLPRAGGTVDFEEQGSIAERCCKKTQIYQDLYPDQDAEVYSSSRATFLAA